MTSRSFIVGDIGGSKSDWRIVHDGNIAQLQSIGFNAYTHDLEQFVGELRRVFKDAGIEVGLPTHLYIAGVDTPQQQEEVIVGLEKIFGKGLEAENDLVGAARSLCGKKPGNVGILGTGSNACYYDGESVSKVSASLGYVLGDEGSGAHLGKKLLAGVFRQQLPKPIIDEFQESFGLTSHEAIQKIYSEPKPNHFLASFAPFVFEHRNQPEVYRIISQAFAEYFEAFFVGSSHQEEPIYFSGSIAHYFSDILRQVAKEKNFEVQKVVEKPTAGLVHYHQEI